MARVILWRHGQTDYNAAFKIQGQIDIPLNETGKAQAAEAAAKLAKYQPTHIVSSDLSRAQDTAGALAALTGLEVPVDVRLQERAYGPWEGLTGDEIRDGWPKEYEAWRGGKEPGSGVERRLDSALRVTEAITEKIDEISAQTPDYTLVVVGHGGALSNAVMYMLGNNPSEVQPISGMNNCHWALLTPQPNRQPRWTLRGYNLS